MTIKKIVFISLAWLFVPYIVVLLIAFLIGVYAGSTQTSVTAGQTSFLDMLTGISILGGIVMAIITAIRNTKRSKK
jgi:pilus assembly protein TadC